MKYILPLFQYIFLGEFGLFTLTPRYLFGVLFPVMIFLRLLSQILPRIPMLRDTSPLINQFFYGVWGLGCTTAALASLSGLTDKNAKSRIAWILVLLVPCSAKLTILAAFASMVTLRVFAVFLLFFALTSALLYLAINKIHPLTEAMIKPTGNPSGFSPVSILKEAFSAVCETVPAFAAGSVIVSLFMYLGGLDRLMHLCGPWLAGWFHLPPEASGLLLLGILKRDFGAASLLALGGKGIFSATQLLVVVLMMTFSVPCFNSSMLLIKQQRLPGALFIWSGSLLISVSVGKIFSEILLLCRF